MKSRYERISYVNCEIHYYDASEQVVEKADFLNTDQLKVKVYWTNRELNNFLHNKVHNVQ